MPLSHIRVVDLCRARTGPTCIRQLSEFGAQVIKVELPGRRTTTSEAATASTSRISTRTSGVSPST